ncbi:MAG TPA: rhodanese-like domain-containing protein [Actinomycetota bacterium]
MFLERFHEEKLGHASYLVGSQDEGEALLVDPRRDVDPYLEAADRRGVRIGCALDTHGHNDYLSGLSEIAARTEAEILASAHGEARYPHRPLKDGQSLEVGEVVVEAMHTPGHTPEHLALLVRDASVDELEPLMLLSGGSLLVGDVARPDLLGGRDEAVEAARVLCRTLEERILTLPDHVEVHPTHVSGSLCAGSIGSRLTTTIGYERRTNPSLARPEDCVSLEDLPAVPPYWRRMRSQNLEGVPLLGTVAPPPAFRPEEVERRLAEGALALDARAPEAFAEGHIPGALSAGLDGSFPTWAGTVLPEGARVVLVLDDPGRVMEAAWHLLRIGYDPPLGYLEDGMEAWRAEGRPVREMPVVDVHELRRRLDDVAVLDVRQPGEWRDGHIAGATHVTGAELQRRLDEVPSRRPLAVLCGTGYRSSASASLLLREGFDDVWNVLGGSAAWDAAGYPTVRA